MDETELIEKAKEYLKDAYDEDTVSMAVTANEVDEDGNGILSVDCTISIEGDKSDWSKDFHFEDGEIVDMDYEEK